MALPPHPLTASRFYDDSNDQKVCILYFCFSKFLKHIVIGDPPGSLGLRQMSRLELGIYVILKDDDPFEN